MDDWVWILIAAAAVVVVVVLFVMLVSRARARRRTARLRARFGPEYDTAVERFGRVEGERLLEERLRAHGSRRLRSVTPEERDAAIRSWNAVQASFVDSPATAVRAADQLVYDVLRDRGYPLESVDERASALSVDDPELAHRYRRAHAELARAEATDGGADAGRLRDALLSYRDVLQELVGVPSLEGRLTTRTDEAAAPAPDPHAPDFHAGDEHAGDHGVRDRGPDGVGSRTEKEDSAWTSTRTDRI